MKNPTVSYRPIGFSLPLSLRSGVASLDICPNVVEALDKPACLASASLPATCVLTITSSARVAVVTLAPPVPVFQPQHDSRKAIQG